MLAKELRLEILRIKVMLALRLLPLIVVNRLVSLVVLMLGYVILLTAAKVSRDYLDIMNCGRGLELIVIRHKVTIGGLSLIIVSSLDPLGTTHHWLALDSTSRIHELMAFEQLYPSC